MFDSFTPLAAVQVGDLSIGRLCRRKTIAAVNGSLPGPVLRVREGDSVIVHVINDSPYDLTVHWHGVIQFRNAWADGPDYITQFPILTGNKYTHRFNVTIKEYFGDMLIFHIYE
ncbi:oxidase [Lithospermum erythrorhizon]|uniref:Oxidase n=1 Tax=Lithospermum erythrorhizon TaxID=34254 RepID=A0AAV3NX38_LITER